MGVISAQSVTAEFTTRSFTTGSRVNADSTPTGTLIVTGVDNGATVTVTNVATGRYKAAVTLPTLALGDIVEINIVATVGGVTDNCIIYRDTRQDACVGDLADVPANFSSMSIDGNGRVDVVKLNGNAAAILAHVGILSKVFLGTVTASPTTTTFIDAAQTAPDNGWWNGRILLFGGTLAGEGTLLTNWNSSTKQFTFKALTRSPTIGDPYGIV